MSRLFGIELFKFHVVRGNRLEAHAARRVRPGAEAGCFPKLGRSLSSWGTCGATMVELATWSSSPLPLQRGCTCKKVKVEGIPFTDPSPSFFFFFASAPEYSANFDSVDPVFNTQTPVHHDLNGEYRGPQKRALQCSFGSHQAHDTSCTSPFQFPPSLCAQTYSAPRSRSSLLW